MTSVTQWNSGSADNSLNCTNLPCLIKKRRRKTGTKLCAFKSFVLRSIARILTLIHECTNKNYREGRKNLHFQGACVRGAQGQICLCFWKWPTSACIFLRQRKTTNCSCSTCYQTSKHNGNQLEQC